jgi:hypothetical protein
MNKRRRLTELGGGMSSVKLGNVMFVVLLYLSVRCIPPIHFEAVGRIFLKPGTIAMPLSGVLFVLNISAIRIIGMTTLNFCHVGRIVGCILKCMQVLLIYLGIGL